MEQGRAVVPEQPSRSRRRWSLANVQRSRYARARVAALRGAAVALTAFLAVAYGARELEIASRPYRPVRYSNEQLWRLARSFVASPPEIERGKPTFRLASDFDRDSATMFVYWSALDQISATVMRDMEWVHEGLAERGLRIVAINVDDSTHIRDVRDEIHRRAFPFEVLLDTPGHSAMLRAARMIPVVFLCVRGVMVRHSVGILPDVGRSIWTLPGGRMLLQRVLTGGSQACSADVDEPGGGNFACAGGDVRRLS